MVSGTTKKRVNEFITTTTTIINQTQRNGDDLEYGQ